MDTEQTSIPIDEAGRIKALQSDARALIRHFEPLAKAKPSDPKSLDAIEKALKALPPSDAIAAAIEEFRVRADALVKEGREARAHSFRRIESDYVRTRRDAGDVVRESGNATWRIGIIELELDRERAKARALYNKEVVAPWAPIAAVDDLNRLAATAEKRLNAASVDEKALDSIFWDAYDHLRGRSAGGGNPPTRVALKDFYREVRVALARYELSTGSAERKLTRMEFPKWAFLLFIDRYRKAFAGDTGRRLNFETGSQHDHQKGLSMVVNGLDPSDDYKSYCYVFAAPGGAR